MAKIAQKKIKVKAQDVTVDVEDLDPNGVQLKIVAQCGSTRLERVHVVGGTDAATMADNIDDADEQAKFDAECARLAALAERAERARLAKQSLQ